MTQFWRNFDEMLTKCWRNVDEMLTKCWHDCQLCWINEWCFEKLLITSSNPYLEPRRPPVRPGRSAWSPSRSPPASCWGSRSGWRCSRSPWRRGSCGCTWAPSGRRSGPPGLSWKVRYRTFPWFFSQMSKFYRARSLLYRCQILQKKIFVGKLLTRSTRFSAIYMLLHRSDLNISETFRHEFWHFFIKFQITSSNSYNFRDDLRCNVTKFCRNFQISQNVQKMLPHTENLKKILGFFNFAC